MNESHAYQVLGWIMVDGQDTEFEVFVDVGEATSHDQAKLVSTCRYPGFYPMESYYVDLED